MRASDTSDVTNPEDLARPARCPVCRSKEVTTTSKVVTAETYWRCCSCGEVWNVGRQRTASRYAPNYSFRR